MLKRPLSDSPGTDLCIRLCFGIPLIAIGMFIMYSATRGGAMGALFAVPLAALFFVLGGLFVAPWIAERVADPAGNLLMPDRRFRGPQPMYSIAEGKRSRCEFTEAIEQYEEILAQHPRDVRSYVAMIDIAATDLHDQGLAEEFYRRACENIRGKRNKARLDEAYEELLSDYH